MELRHRLIDVTVPADPAGAVLVLHGGASRGPGMMVSPTQLSVLRMVPVARRIARAGQGRLVVLRLLNSHRGWDTRHTPVDDVHWALAELAERFGAGLPVGLVGHSLGGRAAILAADRAQVRSAAALAPWVYPSDVPRGGLADKPVLIVHGSRDRIASPQRSAALAERLDATAQVTYVRILGGKHAMLRHHDLFGELAAGFATDTVLGRPAGAAKRSDGGRVRRALAGIAARERFVEV